jgi:hypothetical protein
MASKVETLHPEHAAKVAPDAPAGQLIAALEGMASSLITEQLRQMFENADDVLFEMADKARQGSEKQTFLDTMRTIRVERPRIIKAFNDALHEALSRRDVTATPSEVDLDDLEKWTLQESSDLEEKIAVSNMDNKAASMYQKELTELEQRLMRLHDDTQGAVSPKALCPARILEAFRLSMKCLEVQLPIKLVIYKLFDRVVVANMGQVFAGANQMLEAKGVQPKTSGKAKDKKPSQAQPMWMPQAPQAAAPAVPPNAFQHMAHGLRSEHLAAAMQMYGGAQGPAGGMPMAPGAGVPGGYGGAPGMQGAAYGPAGGMGANMDPVVAAQQNAQLANEMLAVLDATGQGRPVASWMPAQNLALVSRMFDEFYADPQLPENARPLLGRLQFPVMKFAMSDPSFFANPNHPVRALVHDVHDKLSGTHVTQGADFRRLEELIQHLLQRFDPDPTKLRAKAREVNPVSEQEAERFLEQQRERLEQQKRALTEKVRRIVAQELRLHIGDRQVPKPVLPLVLSGIGPMLVTHYRAGGQNHPGWRATLGLLDRVLACLEAAAAKAPDREAEESAVITDVGQALAKAGLPAARIEQLVDPLASVLEELGNAAVAAAPATQAAMPTPAPALQPAPAAPGVSLNTQEVSLKVGEATPKLVNKPATPSPAEQDRRLQLVLRSGDWFRVWCDADHNCRWLKLEQYYPAADTVVFEDFGGENRLKMRATAFVHDLVAGRSSPVDPDPAIQGILKLLPAPPAERIEPGAVWFKAAAAAATG